MARKRGRPKVAGLGYHKNLGQYRKVVNGRSIYFGQDPEEALARYQLFCETGLIWKRGYRQFCLERDGRFQPFGPTMEAARRNFAAHQARSSAQPVRAASELSVGPTDYVVNTVREVGDAYIDWLRRNGRSPAHIHQTRQHFQELLNLDGCGDVALENLTITYFKTWYRHCRRMVETGQRQSNWHNRRMRTVKAGFFRCRKEGWLGVALSDLDALIGVLQQHAGPQQMQEIFTPEEMRRVLRAADLQDRTAILIGLNCAVGNADMGRLTWGDVTQRQIAGRTEHLFEQARGKTGRKRRTPLWPLTIDCIERWRTHRQAGNVSLTPEASPRTCTIRSTPRCRTKCEHPRVD